MDETRRIQMAQKALSDHVGRDDDTTTIDALIALAAECKESAEELEAEAALLQSASEYAAAYDVEIAAEMWDDAASTMATAHELRDAYMRAMFALKGRR